MAACRAATSPRWPRRCAWRRPRSIEVASFYHHFDVVRGRRGTTPAALTVRVCDGLACELAGAQRIAASACPPSSARDVRVIAAPCIGRCEQAPAAVVGQNPCRDATLEKVRPPCRPARSAHEPEPAIIDLAGYQAAGGYALLRQCVRGERDVESCIATMEASGLRGLGGAGFPAGRKWRIVRERAGAAADGGQHRRGRARHLQGPRLPRARPAPLPRRHADRGLGGRHRGDLHLPARRVPRLPRAAASASWPRCRPTRRCAGMPRIELRRGAGAYICGEESAMIESIEGKRGMPRLRPPYVAQVGLFGRPTLEHNFETLYWVRDILEKGADWFAAHGRHGRKGLRSFSVSGRVQEPGREAGAGRHHDPGADRRILRRHAGRPRALRLPAGRRVGRHPARDA